MTHEPEISGAVGFLTIPALLRDLLLRKATGQLLAYQGEVIKKIFFKSGFVMYATSNLPTDSLGDVLLARGMITRDQYEESSSQVAVTGRKQGTLLVQFGALTPKDLFRGLIAQLREIVLSLFSWDTGNWRFVEGLPSQEELVSLRLHPAGLIFEGVARIAADQRWAGDRELQRQDLHPATSPPFLIQELDAPDAARRLLALVEQQRSPAEMARLSGLEDREVTALLYALKLLGLVEAGPQPAAPTAAAAQETTLGDGEVLQLREKVLSLAGQLDSLSHYQILGLTPGANMETIKRSYISRAKEYHPDRFFHAQFDDLQESVNSIFMRINEAYTTLSQPTARAEYDRATLISNSPEARVKEPPEDSHLAQEQFTKGLALLNSGDVWSAIQALRWAVNLVPQSPRYHTWLGVALMRTKKRLHEAEEHCKTAIALDYNNALYYVHLGQVYKTGHLFEKAKKQFETALRLDPKHPGALKEIAELGALPTEKGFIDRLLRK